MPTYLKNAIYLLNQKYNNDSKIPIKLLFGFKGVFGLEDYYEMDSESGILHRNI